MDRYEVVLLGRSQKFYEQAPDDLGRRLDRCFQDLEEDPYRGPNIKLLKTQKSVRWYRYRVGDYRVVYEINDELRRVGVLLILHRSSAYRGI